MDTKQQASVLVMEKYLLGELPDDRAREFEARLDLDPALRRTLEEMKGSTQDFLSRYPAENVVPAILDRYAREIADPGMMSPEARATSRSRRRFLFLAPAAAAAAAFALLLVLRPWDGRKGGVIGLETSPDTTIIKGLPAVDLEKTQLLVFRRRGEEVELMKDGQSASEGDLLQLAYVSGGERYGLILSLDGRGRVTRHFPFPSGKTALLELNAKVLLPVAVELDDAPLFERFFFITSRDPIDEDEVLRLAAALAACPERAAGEELTLPDGLNQYSLLVPKGPKGEPR